MLYILGATSFGTGINISSSLYLIILLANLLQKSFNFILWIKFRFGIKSKNFAWPGSCGVSCTFSSFVFYI